MYVSVFGLHNSYDLALTYIHLVSRANQSTEMF